MCVWCVSVNVWSVCLIYVCVCVWRVCVCVSGMCVCEYMCVKLWMITCSWLNNRKKIMPELFH